MCHLVGPERFECPSGCLGEFRLDIRTKFTTNDSGWIHREAKHQFRHNHHYKSEYWWLESANVVYLLDELLPKDRHETHKIRTKAGHFSLIDGILYRWSFNSPYTRYLSEQEVAYVLKEIHEGKCGNPSGGRSLCNKTKYQGYHWPTMLDDSDSIIKLCDNCQWHSLVIHKLAERLSSIEFPYLLWSTQWTSLIPYREQPDNVNTCLSSLIISRSGSKQRHSQKWRM